MKLASLPVRVVAARVYPAVAEVGQVYRPVAEAERGYRPEVEVGEVYQSVEGLPAAWAYSYRWELVRDWWSAQGHFDPALASPPEPPSQREKLWMMVIGEVGSP